MAWRKKTERIPDEAESDDLTAAVELLQSQIEAARQILKKRPIRSKAYVAWNNKTRDCLIKIYGAGSPNIATVVRASGDTPVWLGMPKEVRERFEASSIENKIQMLAACIISLKTRLSLKP